MEEDYIFLEQYKMDIIYSRNRIRIKKIYLIIFIILILILSFFMIMNYVIYPVYDVACENWAREFANEISIVENKRIMDKYKDSEFIKVEKDKDGNIEMINVDMILINGIVDEVTDNISENIRKQSKERIKIPLGMFAQNKIVSGYGPKINIKVESFSSFSTNLKTEFYSAGINQAIHRVYLDLSYNIIITTGQKQTTCAVYTQIVLLESIIVGKIPNNMYTVEK